MHMYYVVVYSAVELVGQREQYLRKHIAGIHYHTARGTSTRFHLPGHT